ncbi:DUF4910 domain-containing protein [Vibrio cholerae]|uniref:DUF4910 domain-containing protein n=1 Tax=Vibrio cholerae TaxID=666 RepID=UPI00226F141B|nr:DUF4910 domain-containing protein [Vibrio cholerae]MCX9597635.1 DUF4910 domain-containing protein [Vibrio cholerae]
MIGNEIYELAEKLWPINRSLTGEGVRQTLRIIQNEVPELKIFEVPSGTQVFDWVIPKEWNVSDAYIITPSGKKICDFKKNNLHLVGYSTPVSLKLSLAELQEHLYSLPNQPNAIPYITSYYKERWGFCISHEERLGLEEGVYEIYVDTQLFDGSLTYGEILLKGESSKEVFISTYVCHPSMANNELSGPCVTTFLAKKLKDLGRTKYSYRLIFIPETIGSITYLSKNIEHLKKSVVAGFNVSCVGDNRDYSYLPSRNGNTLSDQVAKHVLKYTCSTYKSYAWGDRGSDERQYCAPGVDLPIASIMRTKYGMYDEYHTSLDDLINVVTAEGLDGGFNAIWNAIEALERNVYPKVKVLCEPQLGKRGLYPTLSTKASGAEVRLMMDLITWSDGTRSLIEIAELCSSPVWELYPIVDKLSSHNLMDLLEAPAQ